MSTRCGGVMIGHHSLTSRQRRPKIVYQRSPGADMSNNPPARTIAPTSLVDQAYDILYARIADGELPPGERLVISKFALEFGTSAIPVREALARLLATRLVTFEANRGYRVADQPTAEQIRHFFQARLVFETGAVTLGIDNADDALIDRLEDVNDRMARGRYGKDFRGLRAFVDLNEQFHLALVDLAENPLLREGYEHLGYHQQTVRYNFGRGVPDLAQIVAEHREIIAALRERDAERARAALTHHISDGYERLVSFSAPSGRR